MTDEMTPPEPGMKRLGELGVKEIAAILDAIPNPLTPGSAAEIMINIIMNRGLFSDMAEIITFMLMFASQDGLTTKVIDIDGEEERLH